MNIPMNVLFINHSEKICFIPNFFIKIYKTEKNSFTVSKMN